jgi:hypothetical protein
MYEPIKVAGIETLIANENRTVAEVRSRPLFRGINSAVKPGTHSRVDWSIVYSWTKCHRWHH